MFTRDEIDDYIANAQLRLREKIGDFSRILGALADKVSFSLSLSPPLLFLFLKHPQLV